MLAQDAAFMNEADGTTSRNVGWAGVGNVVTSQQDLSTPQRPAFQERHMVFIGGRWEQALGDHAALVVDSATEEPLAKVKSADLSQLDSAVEAARNAQPGWAATSPSGRSALLQRLHQELSVRAEAIACLIAAEVGTPIRLARSIQVGLPLQTLAFYAELITNYETEQVVGNSTVVREPVGVVGAITPWNYPLHQIMAKVAAALAAGCAVVLKPSGVAPLNAFALAEAVEAADLPPGVFNLVPGPGEEIGDGMASHAGIDMISFTGSTAAGIHVAGRAARDVKRVALELGGKSASIILQDADLAKAVAASVNNAFLNSGQTCSAWSRLLIPKDRLADVVEIARGAAAKLTLGDPFHESTRLGPLVSAEQVTSVREYVAQGLAEGATLALGGLERPQGLERGFYFRPAIFTQVTPDMVIAREEIFGPVLAVMCYTNEADALRVANATGYGLSGAVWSADRDRATRFARGMRTGQVDINGGRFNPTAPFGGFARSGIGRELGTYGLDEFFELKALQF
jgi:aldehyde dehydrogenase (NAD+)